MVRVFEVKDGIEKNNIESEPFKRKYLDEEREEEGERITLRINEKEREYINFLKDNLNYSQDAKVIKQAIKVYRNVIINTLGCDNANDISSQDRRRPQKQKVKPLMV